MGQERLPFTGGFTSVAKRPLAFSVAALAYLALMVELLEAVFFVPVAKSFLIFFMVIY